MGRYLTARDGPGLARVVCLVLATAAAAGCSGRPAASSASSRPAAAPPPTAVRAAPTPEPGECAACGPVHTPSFPYSPYEAVWTMMIFNGADLPFYGMYAYFWVDRYVWRGCAYTDTVAGLFLKSGDRLDNTFGDCVWTGCPVEYRSAVYFDMKVYPYFGAARDAVDPAVYYLTATGPDFRGAFEVRCNALHVWSSSYFSCYDATLTSAEVTFRGKRYAFDGTADFERWWNIGGNDPVGLDAVQGWWLYADMHWDDGRGRRIHTLAWPRHKVGDGAAVDWVHGEINDNGVRTAISNGAVDFDFPENDDADGWPQKYRLTAQLADGRQLEYVASVVREYHDVHPAAWQTPTAAQFREAHDYVEGSMTFEGATYAGRGVHEWQLTEDDPLP